MSEPRLLAGAQQAGSKTPYLTNRRSAAQLSLPTEAMTFFWMEVGNGA